MLTEHPYKPTQSNSFYKGANKKEIGVYTPNKSLPLILLEKIATMPFNGAKQIIRNDRYYKFNIVTGAFCQYRKNSNNKYEPIPLTFESLSTMSEKEVSEIYWDFD